METFNRNNIAGFLHDLDLAIAEVEAHYSAAAALDNDSRLAGNDPAAVVAAFQEHLAGNVYGADASALAALRTARSWLIGLTGVTASVTVELADWSQA